MSRWYTDRLQCSDCKALHALTVMRKHAYRKHGLPFQRSCLFCQCSSGAIQVVSRFFFNSVELEESDVQRLNLVVNVWGDINTNWTVTTFLLLFRLMSTMTSFIRTQQDKCTASLMYNK